MFPLPCLCCLTYALQRLGHAFPHLSAVRALLVRVPLGPRPWLHPLRSRSPGLVRRLHSYYGGVRLLGLVHHRLWLLAFPARTDNLPPAKPKISRFPNKERTCMPGSPTAPDQTGTCCQSAKLVRILGYQMRMSQSLKIGQGRSLAPSRHRFWL